MNWSTPKNLTLLNCFRFKLTCMGVKDLDVEMRVIQEYVFFRLKCHFFLKFITFLSITNSMWIILHKVHKHYTVINTESCFFYTRNITDIRENGNIYEQCLNQPTPKRNKHILNIYVR